MIAARLESFGTSVFSEMSALAREHDAINLSQGFPDFEGPEEVREAAVEAILSGKNQYARSGGVPELVDAIAKHQKHFYDLEIDPLAGVCVTTGATEGIAAAMLGILNPGDEVILFEPFYDSYPVMCALAQAKPRYQTLRFPDFALDLESLEKSFNEKTRLLVLNNPHNPTGKVFTREELMAIADLCKKHDVLVLSDEVYEHLVFDDVIHIPMASLPGMFERTLTLSSMGKTFSFTGWKVGWATGHPALVRAVQAAHQFLTFCNAVPFQYAAAVGLESLQTSGYLPQFKNEFLQRRDFLCQVLANAGFDVAIPSGTYFILCGFADARSDVEMAKSLTREKRVAVIPPSAFYAADKVEGSRLLRFAFCKRMVTLEEAARRLRGD